MYFRILSILMVGLVDFCHTLPFPQEDAENDSEPKHGVQSNVDNQNHRLPDRPRAPARNQICLL